MGLIEPTVVGGIFHSFILRMSVSLGICYYAEKKFVEVREVAEGSEGSIWKGHYGYTRSFIPPEKTKKKIRLDRNLWSTRSSFARLHENLTLSSRYLLLF